VLTLFRELLRARRTNSAFHPAGRQEVLDCDPRLFAILRSSPGGREHALCLHNVSNETIIVKIPLDGEAKQHFAERLKYSDGVVDCTLPPFETVWITTVSPT